MENLPIIKLEISGLKHTVLVALSEYAAKMDEDIQLATERFDGSLYYSMDTDGRGQASSNYDPSPFPSSSGERVLRVCLDAWYQVGSL